MKPLVVVGDALLDRDVEGQVGRLAPDAPVPVLDQAEERSRPGGAALAACLAALDGRPVALVTALGADEAGRELAGHLAAAGVEVVDLGLHGPTPEKVRFRGSGLPMLRLDRGGPPSPVGPLDEGGRQRLSDAAAVLVADYGRGVAARDDVRAALAARTSPRRPVVWDPHPRGPAPIAGVTVATPNERELLSLVGDPGDRAPVGAPGDPPRSPGSLQPGSLQPGSLQPDSLTTAAARARLARERWRARSVAVTLASRGALVVDGDGPPLAVPATPVAGGDPCGAGDRFAGAVATALADGALPSEAVVAAVRAASAFVAAGGAGTYGLAPPADAVPPSAGQLLDAEATVAWHRAGGGTVVATGGCFDLLHAGHVALLRAARSLGSCLVVCLNSDRSVRRLKGPGRPVVPEADRRDVLLALDCVDAVAVFDEDTPHAVLDRLRPHVFAKGGDYAGSPLPEAATLARWGGQAVVLPYLSGRSTTGLLARVAGADR